MYCKEQTKNKKKIKIKNKNIDREIFQVFLQLLLFLLVSSCCIRFHSLYVFFLFLFFNHHNPYFFLSAGSPLTAGRDGAAEPGGYCSARPSTAGHLVSSWFQLMQYLLKTTRIAPPKFIT